MSARSPFRSHLLQQWTQSRRSPIVVQQWLQQATIDEEEEDVSSSPARSSRRHQESRSRRSLHSSHQYRSTISSVEASSQSSIALTSTSWSSSVQYKDSEVNHVEKDRYSAGLSSAVSSDYSNSYDDNRKLEIHHDKNKNEEDEAETFQKPVTHKDISRLSITGKTYPDAIRDMMTPRQTATNEHALLHAPSSKKIQDKETIRDSSSSLLKYNHEEKEDRRKLVMTVDRAVRAAQRATSNNHNKRTEQQPFSFRRLFSSSRSGQRLIDICFQVVLGQTNDESKAINERNKWSKVPAFLITLVHDNQSENAITIDKKNDNDDPYEALNYSPPAMERQLEEYATACAAVQSAIHSLDGDGFASTWATGSIIKTPAFRELVKASPTDRIAALIMVHGSRSTTFSSQQEEEDQLTGCQSSVVHGDLLIDLP